MDINSQITPETFYKKTVLITGGSKGVGRGIALSFLGAGASVIICARNKPEQLPGVNNNTAHYIQADVRNINDIQQCIADTINLYGSLDFLINNAGGTPYASADTASPKFSEAIIQLNLIAPLHYCQAANAVMQQQPSGGCIINISSVSATRASPGTAAYGAAKAGLVNLGSSLAIEWAPKVRVNSVIAGMIRTEQSDLHYGNDNSISQIENTVPLQRLALPKDIGSTCLFLASPMANYISGSSITVHGGGEKPAYLKQVEVLTTE